MDTLTRTGYIGHGYIDQDMNGYIENDLGWPRTDMGFLYTYLCCIHTSILNKKPSAVWPYANLGILLRSYMWGVKSKYHMYIRCILARTVLDNPYK